MTDQETPRLDRSALTSRTRPPERIAHLGLGAFHRAHQAWYTAHAEDAEDWGIVAFGGRSGAIADALSLQGGAYTLIERGPTRDAYEVIGNIVRAVSGSDVPAFTATMSSPSLAVVTLTVTERGYRLKPDGELNFADPQVAHDRALLAAAFAQGTSLLELTPSTPLGKLALGLEARRRVGGGPLAVVPCDNLPGNGDLVRGALWALTGSVSRPLQRWVEGNTAVVGTSVDRITPRASPVDSADVLTATGRWDAVPVVTEPFRDWVLSGAFPAGRPRWETAGARFVDDLEPWEARKLWLLNGAHTTLAASGMLRGHATVADAIADPACLAEVNLLWDEACAHLPDLSLDRYRSDLLRRFRNARIEHRLAQIAQDGLVKLRLRIAPVARKELAAGRPATGCAAACGAWIASCLVGLAPQDRILPSHRTPTARDLLTILDGGLAADSSFARAVLDNVERRVKRT